MGVWAIGCRMPRVFVVSATDDEVTRALDGYARSWVRNARKHTSRHSRNERAERIRELLAANRKDVVFFFLHGRKSPAGIVDHHGAVVVGEPTAELLASRLICGTCYSLDGFAGLAVARRGTVIGYKGYQWVPQDPRRAREMQDAALAAHRALLRGQDAESAANSARREYQAVADMWSRDGTFEGQVLSSYAISNSKAVGFKGVAGRTI
jgi:hypothetical protein